MLKIGRQNANDAFDIIRQTLQKENPGFNVQFHAMSDTTDANNAQYGEMFRMFVTDARGNVVYANEVGLGPNNTFLRKRGNSQTMLYTSHAEKIGLGGFRGVSDSNRAEPVISGVANFARRLARAVSIPNEKGVAAQLSYFDMYGNRDDINPNVTVIGYGESSSNINRMSRFVSVSFDDTLDRKELDDAKMLAQQQILNRGPSWRNMLGGSFFHSANTGSVIIPIEAIGEVYQKKDANGNPSIWVGDVWSNTYTKDRPAIEARPTSQPGVIRRRKGQNYFIPMELSSVEDKEGSQFIRGGMVWDENTTQSLGLRDRFYMPFHGLPNASGDVTFQQAGFEPYRSKRADTLATTVETFRATPITGVRGIRDLFSGDQPIFQMSSHPEKNRLYRPGSHIEVATMGGKSLSVGTELHEMAYNGATLTLPMRWLNPNTGQANEEDKPYLDILKQKGINVEFSSATEDTAAIVTSWNSIVSMSEKAFQKSFPGTGTGQALGFFDMQDGRMVRRGGIQNQTAQELTETKYLGAFMRSVLGGMAGGEALSLVNSLMNSNISAEDALIKGQNGESVFNLKGYFRAYNSVAKKSGAGFSSRLTLIQEIADRAFGIQFDKDTKKAQLISDETMVTFGGERMTQAERNKRLMSTYELGREEAWMPINDMTAENMKLFETDAKAMLRTQITEANPSLTEDEIKARIESDFASRYKFIKLGVSANHTLEEFTPENGSKLKHEGMFFRQYMHDSMLTGRRITSPTPETMGGAKAAGIAAVEAIMYTQPEMAEWLGIAPKGWTAGYNRSDADKLWEDRVDSSGMSVFNPAQNAQRVYRAAIALNRAGGARVDPSRLITVGRGENADINADEFEKAYSAAEGSKEDALGRAKLMESFVQQELAKKGKASNEHNMMFFEDTGLYFASPASQLAMSSEAPTLVNGEQAIAERTRKIGGYMNTLGGLARGINSATTAEDVNRFLLNTAGSGGKSLNSPIFEGMMSGRYFHSDMLDADELFVSDFEVDRMAAALGVRSKDINQFKRSIQGQMAFGMRDPLPTNYSGVAMKMVTSFSTKGLVMQNRLNALGISRQTFGININQNKLMFGDSDADPMRYLPLVMARYEGDELIVERFGGKLSKETLPEWKDWAKGIFSKTGREFQDSFMGRLLGSVINAEDFDSMAKVMRRSVLFESSIADKRVTVGLENMVEAGKTYDRSWLEERGSVYNTYRRNLVATATALGASTEYIRNLTDTNAMPFQVAIDVGFAMEGATYASSTATIQLDDKKPKLMFKRFGGGSNEDNDNNGWAIMELTPEGARKDPGGRRRFYTSLAHDVLSSSGITGEGASYYLTNLIQPDFSNITPETPAEDADMMRATEMTRVRAEQEKRRQIVEESFTRLKSEYQANVEAAGDDKNKQLYANMRLRSGLYDLVSEGLIGSENSPLGNWLMTKALTNLEARGKLEGEGGDLMIEYNGNEQMTVREAFAKTDDARLMSEFMKAKADEEMGGAKYANVQRLEELFNRVAQFGPGGAGSIVPKMMWDSLGQFIGAIKPQATEQERRDWQDSLYSPDKRRQILEGRYKSYFDASQSRTRVNPSSYLAVSQPADDIYGQGFTESLSYFARGTSALGHRMDVARKGGRRDSMLGLFAIDPEQQAIFQAGDDAQAAFNKFNMQANGVRGQTQTPDGRTLQFRAWEEDVDDTGAGNGFMTTYEGREYGVAAKPDEFAIEKLEDGKYRFTIGDVKNDSHHAPTGTVSKKSHIAQVAAYAEYFDYAMSNPDTPANRVVMKNLRNELGSEEAVNDFVAAYKNQNVEVAGGIIQTSVPVRSGGTIDLPVEKALADIETHGGRYAPISAEELQQYRSDFSRRVAEASGNTVGNAISSGNIAYYLAANAAGKEYIDKMTEQQRTHYQAGSQALNQMQTTNPEAHRRVASLKPYLTSGQTKTGFAGMIFNAINTQTTGRVANEEMDDDGSGNGTSQAMQSAFQSMGFSADAAKMIGDAIGKAFAPMIPLLEQMQPYERRMTEDQIKSQSAYVSSLISSGDLPDIAMSFGAGESGGGQEAAKQRILQIGVSGGILTAGEAERIRSGDLDSVIGHVSGAATKKGVSMANLISRHDPQLANAMSTAKSAQAAAAHIKKQEQWDVPAGSANKRNVEIAATTMTATLTGDDAVLSRGLGRLVSYNYSTGMEHTPSTLEATEGMKKALGELNASFEKSKEIIKKYGEAVKQHGSDSKQAAEALHELNVESKRGGVANARYNLGAFLRDNRTEGGETRAEWATRMLTSGDDTKKKIAEQYYSMINSAVGAGVDLSEAEKAQSNNKVGSGIGGVMRRILGGFGLMYMGSMLNIATSGGRLGYAESEQERATMSAYMAQVLGTQRYVTQAEILERNKSVYGGTGQMALDKLQNYFYANQPGLISIGSTLTAGLGAFSMTSWATAEGVFGDSKKMKESAVKFGLLAAGGAAILNSVLNYVGAVSEPEKSAVAAINRENKFGDAATRFDIGGLLQQTIAGAGTGAGFGAAIGTPIGGVGAVPGGIIGGIVGGIGGAVSYLSGYRTIGNALADPQSAALMFDKNTQEVATRLQTIQARAEGYNADGSRVSLKQAIMDEFGSLNKEDLAKWTTLYSMSMSEKYPQYSAESLIKANFLSSRYGTSYGTMSTEDLTARIANMYQNGFDPESIARGMITSSGRGMGAIYNTDSVGKIVSAMAGNPNYQYYSSVEGMEKLMVGNQFRESLGLGARYVTPFKAEDLIVQNEKFAAISGTSAGQKYMTDLAIYQARKAIDPGFSGAAPNEDDYIKTASVFERRHKAVPYSEYVDEMYAKMLANKKAGNAGVIDLLTEEQWNAQQAINPTGPEYLVDTGKSIYTAKEFSEQELSLGNAAATYWQNNQNKSATIGARMLEFFGKTVAGYTKAYSEMTGTPLDLDRRMIRIGALDTFADTGFAAGLSNASIEAFRQRAINEKITSAQIQMYSGALAGDAFSMAYAQTNGMNIPGMGKVDPRLLTMDVGQFGTLAGKLTGQSLFGSSFQIGNPAFGGMSATAGANLIYGSNWSSNKYIANAVAGYKPIDVDGNPIGYDNAGNPLTLGGIAGLQAQKAQLSYEQSMASSGLQMKNWALQYAFNTGIGLSKYNTVDPRTGKAFNLTSGGFWGVEDKSIALQHEQQMWSFGMQERQMAMNETFWQQDIGFQSRQMNMQRRWAKEDWGYQDQTRSLQWQWRQEDFAEQSRFMTGRERRLAERQMGRETVMHNLEGEQIDKARERQKESWRLEDDRFATQKKQHQQTLKFQIEQFEKQKEFYESERKLRAQQLELQRAYWIENMAAQKQQIGLAQYYAREQKKIDDAIMAAQLKQEEWSALVSDTLTKAKLAEQSINNFLDAILEMAGVSTAGTTSSGSGTKTTPKRYGSRGVEDDFNVSTGTTISSNSQHTTTIKVMLGNREFKDYIVEVVEGGLY